LATLRESVNEDKAGLESEVQRLHDQIRDLSEKNKMQLEQINALLFEKVNMQSEGLDQRDRMLQRERDIGYGHMIPTFQHILSFFSELRASLSGKDIPEDIKARLLKLHEDNVHLQEQLKTAQEKLVKARTVRSINKSISIHMP
jgi:protein HOOK3